MAARAMWKGVIRLGDTAVPVKLYSAVEDRRVHFNLLHDEDLVRVRQRMVHPGTGEEVPYDEIRRGYEISRDTFVMLDDEDLEEIAPEQSRDVEVTRFVDPEEIGHAWYDRPYYLGPDPDGSEEAEEDYAALARALEETGREGVVRWVMRNKEYAGALRASGGHLVLVTLRSPERVVEADQLEPPSGRDPDPREREMADKLIGALAGELDLSQFRDEYQDQVRNLIAIKARGGSVELAEVEEKKPEGSLTDMLEQSLAALGERGERKSA